MTASYLDLVTRTMELAPEPLTLRQLALLLYLRPGARTFTEARDDLPMGKPALSRCADVLQRAGLLVREPSRDRRVPVLRLTADGAALAAALDTALVRA